jgi:hypothetical protein
MIWRQDEKSPVLHKFLDIVREIVQKQRTY